MKIAYFGYDFFVDVMKRLLDDGHEIVCLFTFVADNHWNFNVKVLELAEQHKIPVVLHKPRRIDIERVKTLGAELLFAGAYPYKIPGLDLLPGLNLHPTMLPEGRGRWPLPWLVLKYHQHAGLTFHKLDEKWDSGDVLLQRALSVSEEDDLETLSAKLQMGAPQLACELVSKLDSYWKAATPQNTKGSYWPFPSEIDRTIHGSKTVKENLRIVRAFGNFEATAIFDDWKWNVTDASGWVEPHNFALGGVAHRSNREVTLAVSDGYIVLRRFFKDAPIGDKP